MEPKLEDGIWKCPICGFKAMSKKVVELHIQREHSPTSHFAPPENGVTSTRNPGVNEKNGPKNGGVEGKKEKGSNKKKDNGKGQKWRKFRLGSTLIKVLERPEVEIRDHMGWRFWQTANYVASLHKQRVKVKLVDGSEFEGKLKAKDPYFIVVIQGGEKIYINKAHVMWIKPVKEDD